jgi:hypothetical protein
MCQLTFFTPAPEPRESAVAQNLIWNQGVPHLEQVKLEQPASVISAVHTHMLTEVTGRAPSLFVDNRVSSYL